MGVKVAQIGSAPWMVLPLRIGVRLSATRGFTRYPTGDAFALFRDASERLALRAVFADSSLTATATPGYPSIKTDVDEIGSFMSSLWPRLLGQSEGTLKPTTSTKSETTTAFLISNI